MKSEKEVLFESTDKPDTDFLVKNFRLPKKKVYVGFNYFLVNLKEEIHSFGFKNEYGQCCNGSFLEPKTITKIPLPCPKKELLKIASLCSSSFHSLILDKSGKVYGGGNGFGNSFGDFKNINNFFHPGISSNGLQNHLNPHRTHFSILECLKGKKVVDVFISYLGSYFVLEDRRIMVCGCSSCGKDGIPRKSKDLVEIKLNMNIFDSIKDIQGGDKCTIILTKFGKVFGSGETGTGINRNVKEFTEIPFFKRKKIFIKQISVSFNNISYFLSSDNKVYKTGFNTRIPKPIEEINNEYKIIKITGGLDHCFMITQKGVILQASNFFRSNTFKEFGAMKKLKVVDIYAGSNFAVFLGFNGKIFLHSKRDVLKELKFSNPNTKIDVEYKEIYDEYSIFLDKIRKLRKEKHYVNIKIVCDG